MSVQAAQKYPDARRPCLCRSGYAQAGEILCRERFETVPYFWHAREKVSGPDNPAKRGTDGRFSAACEGAATGRSKPGGTGKAVTAGDYPPLEEI